MYLLHPTREATDRQPTDKSPEGRHAGGQALHEGIGLCGARLKLGERFSGRSGGRHANEWWGDSSHASNAGAQVGRRFFALMSKLGSVTRTTACNIAEVFSFKRLDNRALQKVAVDHVAAGGD